jgi:hypothetical protein
MAASSPSSPSIIPARAAVGLPPGASTELTASFLAEVAASIGDPEHASRLATEAEPLARTISDPGNRLLRLTHLASAVAQAGDTDCAARLASEAEALARTITEPDRQAYLLADLARRARAGTPDRASRLATEAEALARTISDPDEQGWALAALVGVAVEANDLDHAEALARTITEPRWQASALTKLASGVAQAGDTNRAWHLLALALSTDSTDPDSSMPESYSSIEEVSHLFPSVIRAAGAVFISAYTAGA